MKNKVKGFTLIELIIVMAIFSVIMFGAMSLMTPANKIMISTETSENGAAAVNSITKFLENELSTVEYLKVYGTVYDDSEITTKAQEFKDLFYGNVLQAGSPIGNDPDGRHYGKGMVHAMTIDSNTGQITKWDYEVTSFKRGTSISSPIKTEWAVNKAYYDSYFFDILIGDYPSPEAFYTGKLNYENHTTDHIKNAFTNLNSYRTSFSVMATAKKKCKSCGQYAKLKHGDNKCDKCHAEMDVSGRAFVNVASMTLVNIYERSLGGDSAATGRYFVVDDVTTPVVSSTVHDRAEKGLTNYEDILSGVTYTDVDAAGATTKGYTLIYSYAFEQNVQ